MDKIDTVQKPQKTFVASYNLQSGEVLHIYKEWNPDSTIENVFINLDKAHECIDLTQEECFDLGIKLLGLSRQY